MTKVSHHIKVSEVHTLAGALKLRTERTPTTCAYRQFDTRAGAWQEMAWADAARHAARWQVALNQLGLQPGDRVALMLRNCVEWVLFDQAALGIGLVTVPVYTNDRAENIAYILEDSGARVLLIEGEDQWRELSGIARQLRELVAVISLTPVNAGDSGVKFHTAADWLPDSAPPFEAMDLDPDTLATIVYTSGTTGRSKGVMLTHRNILWNAGACLKTLPIAAEDEFLSFLPLSHTFERTAGYYLTILTGSTVSFARSIADLAEDLVIIKPTILVTVPRIFERIHGKIQAKLEQDSGLARKLFALAANTGWQRFEYRQGRASWTPALLLWPLLERLVARKAQARLGGRLKYAVSGGAALSPDIARMFIGLGITIIQGYGLTETSPVIAGNHPDDNIPASVGQALEGIEVKVSDHDELIVRSPSVMPGYWNNGEATREAIDEDGWLHTGDQVRIGEKGHIFITGRLKDIIVMANGEKVPPADMELAIAMDPLLEQVMIVGEGRPFLAALVVLNPETLKMIAPDLGLDNQRPAANDPGIVKEVLDRIQAGLAQFPGYARVHGVAIVDTPWSIENGTMTPTMKLKRDLILEKYKPLLEALYAGH